MFLRFLVWVLEVFLAAQDDKILFQGEGEGKERKEIFEGMKSEKG